MSIFVQSLLFGVWHACPTEPYCVLVTILNQRPEVSNSRKNSHDSKLLFQINWHFVEYSRRNILNKMCLCQNTPNFSHFGWEMTKISSVQLDGLNPTWCSSDCTLDEWGWKALGQMLVRICVWTNAGGHLLVWWKLATQKLACPNSGGINACNQLHVSYLLADIYL